MWPFSLQSGLHFCPLFKAISCNFSVIEQYIVGEIEITLAYTFRDLGSAICVLQNKLGTNLLLF